MQHSREAAHNPFPQRGGDDALSEPYSSEIAFGDLLPYFVSLVYRQYPIIVGLITIALTLATGYLLLEPRSFTAGATIIVENRKASFPFGQDDPNQAGSRDTIEGQIDVINSEKIALRVIDKLHLDKEAEFLHGGAFTSRILQKIWNLTVSSTTAAQPDEAQAIRRAVGAFHTKLAVKQLGPQTLEITFRSQSPERAAQVANEIVEAFVVEQINATQLSARSSGQWLQERLTRLQTDAEAAQRAVIEFKQQHKIVEVDGKVLVDQQIVEINKQLVAARIEKAETASRLAALRDAVETGIDVSIGNTTSNDLMGRLRQQLSILTARERDWTARYGPEHGAVITIRKEIENTSSMLQAERQRLASSYARDLQIAEAKEHELQTTMAGAVANAQASSQVEVALRELESAAKTYRTLYDAFLQRHSTAVQQETFPSSAARVLTRAEPPLSNSSPNVLLILGLSLAFGLVAGAVVATARELMDRVIRIPEQVERRWGIECIAVIPAIKCKQASPDNPKRSRAEPNSQDQHDQTLVHYAINEPFSRFTEAVRSIKLSLDRAANRKGVVLCITSALPNEGKSSISGNLAELMAVSGRSTILVDCDLRNPSLSRLLRPVINQGLPDVLTGVISACDAVEKRTAHFHFMASTSTGQVPHSNELVASQAMTTLIEELRSTYEYVILDLPPVAPIVDARTAAHLADFIVIVLEWGKTKLRVVDHALKQLKPSDGQMLGIALNKVDMSILGRFERYGGKYYSNTEYYSRYGYTD